MRGASSGDERRLGILADLAVLAVQNVRYTHCMPELLLEHHTTVANPNRSWDVTDLEGDIWTAEVQPKDWINQGSEGRTCTNNALPPSLKSTWCPAIEGVVNLLVVVGFAEAVPSNGIIVRQTRRTVVTPIKECVGNFAICCTYHLVRTSAISPEDNYILPQACASVIPA
jgi:hypothetical protein